MNINNFNTIITKLKTKKPDSIILFALPDQFLNFAKQANSQKMTLPLFGADIMLKSSILKESNKYSKETYAVHGGVDNAFIKKVLNKRKDASYIYEYAMGQTLGYIFTKLNKKKLKDFQNTMSKIDLSSSPITNLVFTENEKFGKHIRNNTRIYSLDDIS